MTRVPFACITLHKKLQFLNDSENNVGKEENAGNQHFLLFSQCFLTLHDKVQSFGSD